MEWVQGSLEDTEALKRLVAGAGTVFHLAGVVRAGSEADFDRGNRGGTANLVAAVREAAPEARLVHVSSLAAVGPSPDPAGVGPEAEPSPISSYGRSKLAAESEVRALGEGFWWAIVRPPAIYGPRDTDIFEFFRMADRGLVAAPGGRALGDGCLGRRRGARGRWRRPPEGRAGSSTSANPTDAAGDSDRATSAAPVESAAESFASRRSW